MGVYHLKFMPFLFIKMTTKTFVCWTLAKIRTRPKHLTHGCNGNICHGSVVCAVIVSVFREGFPHRGAPACRDRHTRLAPSTCALASIPLVGSVHLQNCTRTTPAIRPT